MAHPPLTRRQRDILRFFEEYSSSQGISPTLDEIARHFGLNKVTIFGHVAELERKGCLRRSAPGISRGLQIVRDEDSDENRRTGFSSPGFPILGTIAAGAPIDTLEHSEVLAFEELAPPGSDVYVLRVRGDSMIEDSIRDGDRLRGIPPGRPGPGRGLGGGCPLPKPEQEPNAIHIADPNKSQTTISGRCASLSGTTPYQQRR